MRITRIYLDQPLMLNIQLILPDDAARHLMAVLRMGEGQTVVVFNGDGYDYTAVIIQATKKTLQIKIIDKINNEASPSLPIHLAQGVCRSEKMDFVVQKATELGVSSITPIMSEFCNIKLSPERWSKKINHWQKVAHSAAEQSGRADCVQIHASLDFNIFVKQQHLGARLILNPCVNNPLPTEHPANVTLLIGPEGGFSPAEIEIAHRHDFISWQLGPRVLRSETAGLAAISFIQSRWGDYG